MPYTLIASAHEKTFDQDAACARSCQDSHCITHPIGVQAFHISDTHADSSMQPNTMQSLGSTRRTQQTSSNATYHARSDTPTSEHVPRRRENADGQQAVPGKSILVTTRSSKGCDADDVIRFLVSILQVTCWGAARATQHGCAGQPERCQDGDKAFQDMERGRCHPCRSIIALFCGLKHIVRPSVIASSCTALFTSVASPAVQDDESGPHTISLSLLLHDVPALSRTSPIAPACTLKTSTINWRESADMGRIVTRQHGRFLHQCLQWRPWVQPSRRACGKHVGA